MPMTSLIRHNLRYGDHDPSDCRWCLNEMPAYVTCCRCTNRILLDTTWKRRRARQGYRLHCSKKCKGITTSEQNRTRAITHGKYRKI